MIKKGAKLIAEAALGLEVRVVVVADKSYAITPPTIKRIAGAAYHLSEYIIPKENATIADIMATINKSNKLAAALSWFINGDESLTDELSNGTIGELADALEAAYSMISTRDFSRAVALSNCVADVTARPK
jgi:hypothetical protein